MTLTFNQVASLIEVWAAWMDLAMSRGLPCTQTIAVDASSSMVQPPKITLASCSIRVSPVSLFVIRMWNLFLFSFVLLIFCTSL